MIKKVSNKIFNTGFTLVELLAVIVILSIILVITVPKINDTISQSTKKSFAVDAKNIINEIEYALMEDKVDSILELDESDIESTLGINNINYEKINVFSISGSPYVVIKGKNKWEGFVAYGNYREIKVENEDNYDLILSQLGYNSIKGVNEPLLSKGMTPIKWDGTDWINTTESDIGWYDYTNKQWANARTEDGSMWVWIPRYVYKINSGWHSNTTGTIEVKFSMGTDDTINNTVTLDTGTTSNASNNKWTNHPGFTFGTTELTGIWVAKFEATAIEGVANGYVSNGTCPTTGDNVTTKTIKVIPNVVSWRCITPGNAYTVVRNMETKTTYGWDIASTLKTDGTYTTDTNNVDTHLMKNIEWGAIAYLSKSTYGKSTTEIWINNDQNYTTGCAANSASQSGNNGCLNTYETTNGVQASTTGNIYGVYDISGSAWEIVSAYVDNANANLTSYGTDILNANAKYKDIYTKAATDDSTNNYALTINKKGDAIYETSNSSTGIYSWFGDSSSMAFTSSPWFVRGGFWYYVTYSGAFAFFPSNGYVYNSFGFRPIIVVGKEF